MTAKKELELAILIEFFSEHYSEKFRAGHEKHGKPEDPDYDEWNDFTVEQLLWEALEENLDQFSYLVKAIMKLKE